MIKDVFEILEEFENIGFNILRGLEENGQYSELDSYKNNLRLIGAGNSSEEHLYRFIDDDVSNNITYWYKLLDVDIRGISSEYGPISIMHSDKKIKPEKY